MGNEKKFNPVIIAAVIAFIAVAGLYFVFDKQKNKEVKDIAGTEQTEINQTQENIKATLTEKVYTVAEIYTEGANNTMRKIVELSKNCQIVEIKTESGIIKLIDTKLECLQELKCEECEECPQIEENN